MTQNHQLVYKYRHCLCIEFISFHIKSSPIGRLLSISNKKPTIKTYLVTPKKLQIKKFSKFFQKGLENGLQKFLNAL